MAQEHRVPFLIHHGGMKKCFLGIDVAGDIDGFVVAGGGFNNPASAISESETVGSRGRVVSPADFLGGFFHRSWVSEFRRLVFSDVAGSVGNCAAE